MTIQEVTVGDDIGIMCTLSRGGAPIIIDPTSTIRVAITNDRKDISYTETVAISLLDPLHNLPVGTIWVVIPEANTLGLIPGDAVLEIEVADPTQEEGNQIATWNLPVKVLDSTIS